MLWATFRAGLTTTVLITAYFLLPFTLIGDAGYLVTFLIALAIIVAVLGLEFSRTLLSPYPRLRAVEAMMTAGPLFVVLFAAVHFLIATVNPPAYTQPMTRLDALYFTVTTFATVGYGDISPVSQVARLAALLQMVIGLLLVGVIARLLFGIAQESDQLHLTRDPAARSRSPRHPPS
jgi:hypothetical protein